jgi:hypothetical protein
MDEIHGSSIGRMSGENEVLLENLEVDVQSRDRTYNPKYQSRCIALSLDVQSRVCQGTLFSPAVSMFMFPYFRVVFVEIELINRIFLSIRGYEA